MVYNALGLMSGSSLDGLDICFAEFQEVSGKWTFKILKSGCINYPESLKSQLQNALNITAREYLLLDVSYGKFVGEKVNEFISQNSLEHKVNLVASHGHTIFHDPENYMTHQLGDGATIASITGLPVVCSLRSMDVALRGQGAPIVPVGEKLLFPDAKMFLNIGGIANVSIHNDNTIIAFDVCAANRLLNLLAAQKDQEFDAGGTLASMGTINDSLLQDLNNYEYYTLPFPKSLSNEFGTQKIYPHIISYQISVEDALATYCEHIAIQIKNSLLPFSHEKMETMLITGGGAFNTFLVNRIQFHLKKININVALPGDEVINYKEALIMALLGILRWREQNTTLSSVTGASRDSIGGALWMGAEA